MNSALPLLLALLTVSCSLKGDLERTGAGGSFKVPPISLEQSEVLLSASTLRVGETATATLQLPVSGLEVAFSSEGGTAVVEIGSTHDHGNGTYSSLLTATAAGTPVRFRATLGSLSTPPSAPLEVIAVPAAEIASVSIEDASDGSGGALGGDLRDGIPRKVYLIARDADGAFLSNVSAKEWKLTDASHAVLSASGGASVRILPHRGPTPDGGSFRLAAAYEADGKTWKTESSPLTTSYRVAEAKGLSRWYKADVFLPAEGPLAVESWTDLSSEGFDAIEEHPGTAPQFFSSPLSVLFGEGMGPLAQALRIAKSFRHFAPALGDFAILAVVTRGTAERARILGSNHKKKGIDFGWTDERTFRLGLRGPEDDEGAITASLAVEGDAPVLLTAQLLTGGAGDELGLRLYRNGELVASNSRWTKPEGGSGAIPFLGGDSAGLRIHEFVAVSRGLPASERCETESALAKKWEIKAFAPCP